MLKLTRLQRSTDDSRLIILMKSDARESAINDSSLISISENHESCDGDYLQLNTLINRPYIINKKY